MIARQERVKVKNSAGWSWGLRVAEVIPKVVTGRAVGGWSEAWKKGESLGLFCLNTAEARDRSRRPLRVLPSLNFIAEYRGSVLCKKYIRASLISQHASLKFSVLKSLFFLSAQFARY